MSLSRLVPSAKGLGQPLRPATACFCPKNGRAAGESWCLGGDLGEAQPASAVNAGSCFCPSGTGFVCEALTGPGSSGLPFSGASWPAALHFLPSWLQGPRAGSQGPIWAGGGSRAAPGLGTCAPAKPCPFEGPVSTGTGAEGHRVATCQSAVGCPRTALLIRVSVRLSLQDAFIKEKMHCPRPATPECYEKEAGWTACLFFKEKMSKEGAENRGGGGGGNIPSVVLQK